MCLPLNGMTTLKLLIVKPAAIGDNRGVSLTRNTVLTFCSPKLVLIQMSFDLIQFDFQCSYTCMVKINNDY